MLKVDLAWSYLPLSRDRILALYESINAPLVSIPSVGTAPTQAYVLGVRGEGAAYGVLVVLRQPEHDANLIYVSEPRSLTAEQYRYEEAEALRFVESMGFLASDTNFRGLGPEQQDETMRRMPIFHPPGTFPGARPSTAPMELTELAQERSADPMFGGLPMLKGEPESPPRPAGSGFAAAPQPGAFAPVGAAGSGFAGGGPPGAGGGFAPGGTPGPAGGFAPGPAPGLTQTLLGVTRPDTGTGPRMGLPPRETGWAAPPNPSTGSLPGLPPMLRPPAAAGPPPGPPPPLAPPAALAAALGTPASLPQPSARPPQHSAVSELPTEIRPADLDAPRAAGPIELDQDGLARLGRFLATFGLLVLVGSQGCRTVPGPKDQLPPPVQTNLDLADQLLREQQLTQAVGSYKEVLLQAPNSPIAHSGLGTTYLFLGRREDAEQHLREAVRLDPEYSTARNTLAAMLLETGACQEAVELLTPVVEDVAYPTPEFAQDNLARAEGCVGRPKDGIQRLARLVNIRPKFCRAYLTLAELSRQAKEHTVTVSACAQFAQQCEADEKIQKFVSPEHSALCYLRSGQAQVALGDLSAARSSFESCRSEGPFGQECRRALEVLERE